MSATYDHLTDTITRVSWEAIRAYRASHGIQSMLPYIDASNEEKAGLWEAVVKAMSQLKETGNIAMSQQPTPEDILVVNIVFALMEE